MARIAGTTRALGSGRRIAVRLVATRLTWALVAQRLPVSGGELLSRSGPKREPLPDCARLTWAAAGPLP
jgi:hypothetical protein